MQLYDILEKTIWKLTPKEEKRKIYFIIVNKEEIGTTILIKLPL
ncbi:hypothetical protein bcere0009_17770 [Bacillus cereus R309803]|nr:hypothetical protein bcere0009_17770 [Bacillus cereus R309803]